MVARLSIVALVLTGCIREPDLKSCAEFPVDSNTAVCGSPCDIYCNELLANCREFIGAVDPPAACQAACSEILAPGTFNDESGDSVACRTRQAVRARKDPAFCTAALFDGGGICINTPCDDYCDQMAGTCPDMFQSRPQCLAACQLYPTGGDPQGGNSLECRLFQLGQGNCEDAGITGRDICGTACEGYCTQAVPTCAGRTPLLSDETSCLTLCEFMSVGSYTDWQTDTDSVQCRAWHAGGPAQLDPDSHCAHASLYNDQHCGDTCGTWCSVCLDKFGGDFGACLPDCQARVTAGEVLFPDPAAPERCGR
jgi:hypothetical protein